MRASSTHTETQHHWEAEARGGRIILSNIRSSRLAWATGGTSLANPKDDFRMAQQVDTLAINPEFDPQGPHGGKREPLVLC